MKKKSKINWRTKKIREIMGKRSYTIRRENLIN
jgi:hypothetical protein